MHGCPGLDDIFHKGDDLAFGGVGNSTQANAPKSFGFEHLHADDHKGFGGMGFAPFRIGQVYARGRDLVVLAMVNAGAEVIADGHIHVYAPLRGKAMAGARGNSDARIFALALEAELLSIASVYRTSEHPLPASVRGKPTQVRLVATPDGGKLMMDRM